MSRAAIALGRVSFRFSFLYLAFALVEAPALNSNGFGATPIIPTAFLVCVNGVATLVSLGLTLAATLATLSPFKFSWRALCSWIFTITATYVGFSTCLNVLLPS